MTDPKKLNIHYREMFTGNRWAVYLTHLQVAKLSYSDVTKSFWIKYINISFAAVERKTKKEIDDGIRAECAKFLDGCTIEPD